MSEIDYRYPYPVWIKGYKHPFEARILPPQFDQWSKQALVASCINSIELLKGFRFGERRVVGLLYKAMELDLGTVDRFEETPKWIRFSTLTKPTLTKFKRLLIQEIEERMILFFDKDPEDT